MRAWVFQDPKQVKNKGKENASWYVGWYDPEGKQRSKSLGKRRRGQEKAEKYQRRIEGELTAGTYEHRSRVTWEQFRKDYEEKVVTRKGARSQPEMKNALTIFERIIKPKRMSAIKTSTIDTFIAKRRMEKGKKGTLVSPATVNNNLRHIKAALRKAELWGLLAKVPHFDFEKVPGKIPRYVTAEHFAAIYLACANATRPADLPNVDAAEWWRALIVMAYMTGWRISELRALRREDIDLEVGTAFARHSDSKGNQDAEIRLHPVVVEHLKRISSFDSHVFAWNYDQTTLYSEFHTIQQSAKVKDIKGNGVSLNLPCREDHEHTPNCHVYGFHDFRRAFATMNADRITPDALQELMRHKSYLTTKRYIAMARQIDASVESLHVPDILKNGSN